MTDGPDCTMYEPDILHLSINERLWDYFFYEEELMLENIFAPYSDLGLLILRVGLGVVFLAHGWPKINPNSPMHGVAGVAGFFK